VEKKWSCEAVGWEEKRYVLVEKRCWEDENGFGVRFRTDET
jgi:hypothetical protein